MYVYMYVCMYVCMYACTYIDRLLLFVNLSDVRDSLSALVHPKSVKVPLELLGKRVLQWLTLLQAFRDGCGALDFRVIGSRLA